ncbi:MAG: GAF domain-containing protein [Spirochaetia bacterium]|nr:GAF domain-containing protein [Spirochaetia bacterium]
MKKEDDMHVQDPHRAIIESLTQQQLYAVDHDCCYTYLNPLYRAFVEKHYGYAPVAGEDLLRIIPDENCGRGTRTALRTALEGTCSTLVQHYGRDVYQESFGPLYDAQGRLIGATGTAVKIVKHHCSDEELDRYRSIFEHTDSAICLDRIIYDDEGTAVDYRIIDINPGFERILGLQRDSVIGRPASEAYGLAEAPFLDIYREVAETGIARSFESFFAPAQKYLSITASSPERGVFTTVFSDITERKWEEAQLQELLQREHQKNQELAALHEGAQAVLMAGEIEQTAQSLYRIVKDLTASASGFILIRHAGDEPPVLLFSDLPGRDRTGSSQVPPGLLPHIDSVLASGTPVCRQAAEVRTEVQGGLKNDGSLLIVPLHASGLNIGVICLIGSADGYHEHERTITDGIANLLTLALQADISRKKLLASERLYDEFINTHGDLIFVKDEQLRYTIANDALLQFLGKERSEVIGKTDYEIFDPVFADACRKTDLEAMSSPSAVVALERDGQGIFESTKFTMQLESGKFNLGGIIRDVSERIALEASQAKNEQRLQTLVRILEHPARTTREFLKFALEEAIELTESTIGYIYYYHEDREEFVLDTWSGKVMEECEVLDPKTRYDLKHTGLWGEAVRQRKAFIVNDYGAENPLKKGIPEGHVQLSRYMTAPVIIDEQIVAVVGVANRQDPYGQEDLLQLQLLMESVWRETEHRSTQDELKRIAWMLSPQLPGDLAHVTSDRDQGYGDLTELNESGLIRHSIDRETLRNLAADYMDLLGTSSAIYELNGDYAMGIFESGWCRMADQASRELCDTDDNRAALLSGKWLCHESCWNDCSKRAIETEGPVDIICSGGLHLYALPIFSEGQVIGAINFGYGDPPVLQSEQIVIAQRYGIDRNDVFREAAAYASRPPYIIAMAKRRLADTARLIGLLVQEKQYEARQHALSAQLRQSQKMEAVGQLAGGIAHDFNNILQAIMGYTQLLMLDAPPAGELTEGLTEIYACGERASALTRQLLTFSRRQILKPQPLDLNVVIENLKNMLTRVIGEHISLEWYPSADLGTIDADISMMEQVLVNLCVNARDAITTGGIITIETSNVTIDQDFCAVHPWAKPGDFVRLSISDNGIGMTEEIREQIFEPFFTTKSADQGTGLGLSTVYGIVKQHDGVISAYSEPGKGTVINTFYPRSEQMTESSEQPSVEAAAGGSETILVAEDDAGVQRLVLRILERAGYTVLLANDGEEALLLFEQHTDTVSLLLLDVMMPGMGGEEAYEHICRIRADVPVIFATGYSEHAVHTNFVLNEGLRLLQKPYTSHDLLSQIRSALEA